MDANSFRNYVHMFKFGRIDMEKGEKEGRNRREALSEGSGGSTGETRLAEGVRVRAPPVGRANGEGRVVRPATTAGRRPPGQA